MKDKVVKIVREFSDRVETYNSKDELHSFDDEPAVFYTSGVNEGDKLWYKSGFKHRDNDLPALIRSNGCKTWYKHGLIHRDDDKPAQISPMGKSWYKNGKLHREGDKHSTKFFDGSKYWHKEGKLFRLNGPAVVKNNGEFEFFHNGIKVSESGLKLNNTKVDVKKNTTNSSLISITCKAKLTNSVPEQTKESHNQKIKELISKLNQTDKIKLLKYLSEQLLSN